MKQVLQRFIALLIGVFTCGAMTAQTDYYDFKEGSLYYLVTDYNSTPKKAKVVAEAYGSGYSYYRSESSKPTGDITIPATVSSGGNTYSVTEIDGYAFNGCSGLTSVTISNGITKVGYVAFRECTGLTSVTIPQSVTMVEEAFTRCTKLITINLAATNATYTVQDGVLYSKDFTKLIHYPAGKAGTSFSIPSTVTSISELAFAQTKLTDITVPWTTPPTINEYMFYEVTLSKVSLYVPAGSEALYRSANEWKNFGNIGPIVRYGVWIANTELTSANADAITNTNFPDLGLTRGNINYDHSNKTITLNNVKANVTRGEFISITDDAVNAEYTINLIGTNEVDVWSDFSGIFTEQKLKITGSSLKVNAWSMAIYVDEYATLTIDGTTVEAIGRYGGIVGYEGKSGEKLVIKNSTVKATGGDQGSICDLQDITLTGCAITSPTGVAVAANGTRGKAVMKDGNLVTEEVVIEPEPVVGYGIYITGTEVTSANASAINWDNFPNLYYSGTVIYDHATKTFTLDNLVSNVYTDGGFIRISEDAETAEYKIKLVGRNVISLGYIETYKKLTIEGDGTLKVNLEVGAAILVQDNSTLTIKNTNVRAIGTWGIAGFNGRKGEKLVIKNSTVRATSTGEGGSIMDLQDITLYGCRITSPAGAAVAANGTRGKAVMKDGEVVTEEVEILPTGTGIDAPQAEPLAVYPNPAGDFVTIETDAIGSAITIIDLSGRVVMTATANDAKITLNVSSLPTGTYIVRAANRVTKIIKM